MHARSRHSEARERLATTLGGPRRANGGSGVPPARPRRVRAARRQRADALRALACRVPAPSPPPSFLLPLALLAAHASPQYRERIIFIGQKIDEEFGNKMVATMLYLDSESDKPITLYVNSPGGETTPALCLYDTMNHVKSPVATLAFGQATNMALFLLAAGKKGSRYSLPHTRLIMGQPGGAARGQASDIQVEAGELLRLRQFMWQRIAQMTGKEEEEVANDFKRDKFFSPEEAQKYGLIDNVLTPRKALY